MSLSAAIAVNRFGLGAAPGELAAASSNPRAWLAAQIAQPAPLSPELAKLHPSAERLQEYPRWIASLGQGRADMQGGMQQPGRTIEETFRAHMGPILIEEI